MVRRSPRLSKPDLGGTEPFHWEWGLVKGNFFGNSTFLIEFKQGFIHGGHTIKLRAQHYIGDFVELALNDVFFDSIGSNENIVEGGPFAVGCFT